MTRFVFLAIALTIALLAPASAGTIYRYMGPTSAIPKVAAGEIDAAGNVERGVGFAVSHIETGEYTITFNRGYFPSGCAAMTVTVVGEQVSPPIGEVYQTRCGNSFRVVFWFQGGTKVDQRFNFVAVED
jgi:hypothetical protein